MLRDIERRDDDILTIARIIAQANADILVLQGIDYDFGGATAVALRLVLQENGIEYPFHFTRRPNSGLATGLDLDGDGKTGTPRDAQGYGRFSGQDSILILSRFEILHEGALDFSDILWKDMSGATLPMVNNAPFPSIDVQAIQRLSTTAHWDVPILLPDGQTMNLLTYHATPPVFDGPEDRNGLRNHDETLFWVNYINDKLENPFVIAGISNLDPVDGDGRPDAMLALLNHPNIQDPKPTSLGGQQNADANHKEDPALDTAVFDGPGNLRVDYVLPSSHWQIKDAGVLWPTPGTPLYDRFGPDWETVSRHRLVWVDLDLTR
ncbi:endonuclease/exonuclease/phosphatase family protein [Parasulfitobacter algicola]|uniref:Endonuclease/exonuclease/phosphatase family protein n=1 Tax=Parasulfitobacter algicola TaxID=2614809 RepID=A0ABX2IS13_9RHOB|nr:endonuclease/exonuclease/phosphatase family protein [Sulfitobacter algicola]NSX55694.1 endonuclease/exonuclease/phosphatase family protein [Sulfitobacter algicola]